MSYSDPSKLNVGMENSIGFEGNVRAYVEQEVPRANLLNYLPVQLQNALVLSKDNSTADWLRMTLNFQVETAEVPDLRSTPESNYGLVVQHEFSDEVKDPLEQLRSIQRVLQPGGRVSLVADGYPAALRSASGPAEIRQLRLHNTHVNHLGKTAMTYTAAMLRHTVRSAGFQIDQNDVFGVGLFTADDVHPASDIETHDLEELIHSEIILGRKIIWLEAARKLHVIAKKPTSPPKPRRISASELHVGDIGLRDVVNNQ